MIFFLESHVLGHIGYGGLRNAYLLKMKQCVLALCIRHMLMILACSLKGLTFHPFCKLGQHNYADFHWDGSDPSSRDFWNRTSNMGDSSVESVLSIMGLILSGPQALCGFRLLRSFSMPFLPTVISGMVGTD